MSIKNTSSSVSALRVFGAIMLIVGTSVGGGMLALPIATAQMGFFPALVYLLLTWLAMTAGALLVLEVNCWLPQSSNLISMAGHTVGKWGQGFAWVSYLLLFYCLLASYIAGGQEVMATLFGYAHIQLSSHWAVLVFLGVFSLIVYSGIRHVDWMNRLVMVIKLICYFGVVILTLPLVKLPHLIQSGMNFAFTTSMIMVMITAYGFAIIVPSLRCYLNDNQRVLRNTVMIGSLIPLLLYVLWECVIFSVLPSTGEYSLQSLAESKAPVSALMQSLSQLSHSGFLSWFADVFTSVCVITAFMGVSLCLLDFLADGLGLRKTGATGIGLYVLTFAPPLVLVLTASRVFVYGLSLAGIFCVFLLMLLPTWMAWVGRYQRNLSGPYRLPGGKVSLIVLALVSLALFVMNVRWAFG